MVFYFTGTGNSLYIAKQIEEKPVRVLVWTLLQTKSAL